MALGRPKALENLTGAQKSAVLCIALGPAGAAKLLQKLQPDEVEQVTREIAQMRTVGADVVGAVMQEFRDAAQQSETVAFGGPGYAQQVLEQAVGPARAATIVERLQERRSDGGLRRLKRAAPEVLAGVVRGEHPQTIALILAHLDLNQAARVVAAMDPELASEVLYRVARMEKVSPDMLALIESGLATAADLSLTEDMTLSGGPGAVAKVLNLAGGPLERELFENLQRRNETMAQQIRALMFTFEDLLLVDNKGMQRVLREVETRDLALAMKATSEELKAHIKKAMSERAAAALEEEIELLGPVRVKEVDAAQARVLEVVRRLEDADEIIIQREGGSDDVVV